MNLKKKNVLADGFGGHPSFIPEPQHEYKVRSNDIRRGTGSQLHFRAKKCRTVTLFYGVLNLERVVKLPT